MKAIEITRHGGPKVLKVVQIPSPELHADEVRVQVFAAGVNFADIMMRQGLYPEAPRPPFVPGYEIAGKVVEIGPEVKELKPGDSVLSATRFGGYSSEVVLPEKHALRIPKNLSFVEAAAIPVNYVTAWLALTDMARVRHGDRVLIHSAAGGVGVAATQIAIQAGAHVVGLVGNSDKISFTRKMGVHEVWLKDDWRKLKAMPRNRFDIILDSSGADDLKRSFDFLNPLGRIITFGVSGIVRGEHRSLLKASRFLLSTPLFTPFKLMMENKGIFGLNILKLAEQSELMLQRLNRILDSFEDGVYKPVVSKTFPLSEAGAAHQFLEERRNLGKVILEV